MLGLCSTCLSVDRNVTPINDFQDKSLFMDWLGNVILEDLNICWECNAMFSRINKFKNQVFKAQKIRFRVAHKKLRHMITLTNLSIYNKHTYDKIYRHNNVDSANGSNAYKKRVVLKKETTNGSNISNDKIKQNTENGKPRQIQQQNENNINKYKRKLNNSANGQSVMKKIKKEKTKALNKFGTNIGSKKANKQMLKKPSERKVNFLTEDNFTVIHLTEENMLKTRELDRKSPRYKSRAFKCEKCIIGFLEKHQLKKHIRDKHSKFAGQLICPVCEVRFTRRDFFQYHHDCHYRSYKCLMCDYEHHRRNAMEAHQLKEHDEDTKFQCTVCNKDFDSNVALQCHQNTEHKDPLICDQCGKPFIDDNALNEHIKALHTENTPIIPPPLSSHTYQGTQSLRAQMQLAHARQEPHNAYCGECDVQYGSVHKYKRHLEESKKHALIEQFRYGCDDCDSKFLTDEFLQRHVERAHRQLPHVCDICEKGFSGSKRLKIHLLEKHEVVRRKDKICPCCSKGFYVRSALLNHLRTHTAEKPFQCEQCHKRFAVMYTLKKHVQRRHPDDDNN